MKRFRHLSGSEARNTVTINIEGRDVAVPEGESVAAAVLAQDLDYTRTSPVSGAPRTPLCLMGACFECLMEIDGVRNRQACLVTVAEGMRIRRQQDAGE
jgi:predicted molibdopterin-dependent oxidoreductase YjgC